MSLVFEDHSFDFELLRALGYSVSGGADIGECLSTASRIREGDTQSWYTEWKRTAERVHAFADASLARGERISARESYLRASNYYRCAEFYLHITPDDARSLPTWEQSRSCFRQALALFESPYEEVEIPYEGTTLPGYFYRVDASETPRPTLILHGGYDSTGEELYCEHVYAALARGYHCLAFEGPGQGSVIRQQHVPFRPDWEAVITPVVDYVISRPEVDPSRLVLLGISLGGYLAPRAAAYEHRLAACVAIDGIYSFGEAIEKMMSLPPTGHSSQEQEAVANALAHAQSQQNTLLRWSIAQGMWTFAASSPFEVMQEARHYTMQGCAEQITCPLLVCDAQEDLFFQGQARKLYDAVTCPKTYLAFSSEEGAGAHCHFGALTRLNQELFAWLDQTLG
ncbi:alpha/beta hydrolase family protein [Ktedonospora formicarum]|uniref:Alpha/beta hydrolase n=1 Tax=Ktedonospora formicarum TaxID=2778364 RepID=A0A8J3I1V5_9CHLR|nr:alpha/beta fold hydrolase [Ktedonospora formicarum]GHO47789.1 alpha/beta hydrolase [Ktedonospora formicarum]